MAEAIAITAAAISASASAAADAGTITATTALAISAGVALVSTVAGFVLASNQKPPEQRVQGQRLTQRGSIMPRRRLYGQILTGGALVFRDVNADDWYVACIILSDSEIESIEEIILDDDYSVNPVADIDGNHYVTKAPYDSAYLRISYGLGGSEQVADPLLSELFPSNWTSNHRLRGMAYIVVAQKSVASASKFRDLYPNHFMKIQAIIRGTKSLNTDGTINYSDNAARVLLDYLCHTDGYGLSLSDDIDITSFNNAITICDQDIALKAGGTEKRYRFAGGYDFDSQPKDILQQILAVMAGQIFENASGKLALRVGIWSPPDSAATFHNHHYNLLQIQAGNSNIDHYNIVRAKFISPAHRYQLITAPDYQNGTPARPVIYELDLSGCPSGTQAQRLSKIVYNRLNPDYLLDVRMNLKALMLIEGDSLLLSVPDMGWLDKIFHVQSMEFEAMPAHIGLKLIPDESRFYDWDAVTEEQDIAEPDTITGSNPEIGTTSFTLEFKKIVLSGGSAAVQAVLTWSDDGYDRHVAAFKKSADSNYDAIAVNDGETRSHPVLLDLGVNYDFWLARVTLLGKRGDWQDNNNVTASYGGTPPEPLISLSASWNPVNENITLTTRSNNDGNFYRSRIEIKRPLETTFSFLLYIYHAPLTIASDYFNEAGANGTYEFQAFAESKDYILSTTAKTATLVI